VQKTDGKSCRKKPSRAREDTTAEALNTGVDSKDRTANVSNGELASYLRLLVFTRRLPSPVALPDCLFELNQRQWLLVLLKHCQLAGQPVQTSVDDVPVISSEGVGDSEVLKGNSSDYQRNTWESPKSVKRDTTDRSNLLICSLLPDVT
jgi:hypothetical protein